MDKPKVDLNYKPDQADFMQGCMREIAKQDDFKGIGGHDLQDHGPHGLHSQVSIGLGDTTVNFRELAQQTPPPPKW